MSATQVLVLSDERPGHYRLSEGVIAAIARHQPVNVERIIVKRPWLLPKAFVPKVANRLPPRITLRMLHGLSPERVIKPDLVISAGGLTLGANTAFAALLGAANVFCGTTRGFALDKFSLVLTDDPAEGGPRNVQVCPKPSAFDPDELPRPRSLDATGTDLRIGVLIGGPTEYAAFDQQDWQMLANLIDGLVAHAGATAIVVTGPRTPQSVYPVMQAAIDRNRDRITLVDFRTAGPGSSLKALQTDLVLVTSDSMSMMTEAALSQRPSIAIRPRSSTPSRDDAAIDMLIKNKWLALCDLATTSPADLLATTRTLKPMTENHLDQLAEKVLPLLTGK